MAPTFHFLILLSFGHSVHKSSAARERPGLVNLTAPSDGTEHDGMTSNSPDGSEHDDVTGNTPGGTEHDDVARTPPGGTEHDDMAITPPDGSEPDGSTNNRVSIVSHDPLVESLSNHPTANHSDNWIEGSFIRATWNRSFKQVSSFMDAATHGRGVASDLHLVGVFIVACVIFGSVIVYLYTTNAEECSKVRRESGKERLRASEKVESDSGSGSSSNEAPKRAYPSSFISNYLEQDEFPEQRQETASKLLNWMPQPAPQQDVNVREVIARLSQTIKKVPTGQISHNFHSWFGIGPQERHVAVWWREVKPKWPDTRLGWWRSKQDHLARKAPKGELLLKDVSFVKFVDNEDELSGPSVCVTHNAGADDLLLFFPNSALAEQFSNDLLLLVKKVKRVTRT